MRKIAVLLGFAASLAACTDFPELDAAVSEEAKRADFPRLVPAQQILDQRKDARLTEADGPNLLARADRLRRRGEILRNIPVIDEAARLRFARVLRSLGG